MKKVRRIALIGLDGSGKSANITRMKNDIDYDGFQFVWVRWEPKLLAPAYWVMEKSIKKKKTSIKAEYHTKTGLKEKIFKASFVRTVWMVLALLDYWFQFYAKTIKLLISNKSLVFDRFYLDLFVDQGINFGYSPEKIEKEIKKYQKLFPKVNHVIYIRVSPNTCLNRKDDIPSMEYLTKRYDIYERMSSNTNWITIDGEAEFEVVYSEIKKRILQEV